MYRVFIPNLIGLTDETKSEIAQAIVEERFTEIEIFSKAEEEVLAHMKGNLYPNFLKSDIYLSACAGEEIGSIESGSYPEIRQSEGEESVVLFEEEHDHGIQTPPSNAAVAEPSFCTSAVSTEGVVTLPVSSAECVQQITLPNQLQTVHEDKELNMVAASQSTHSKPRKHFGLTKEALLATEFQRATQTKFRRESGSSRLVLEGEMDYDDYMLLNSNIHYFDYSRHLANHQAVGASVPFPYHASYSSYNPVSRVDSEIQSVSSGASALTDEGSVGGRRRPGLVEKRSHEDRSSHRSHCRSGDPSHAHAAGRSQRRLISGVDPDVPVNTSDNLNRIPGVAGTGTRQTGPNAEASDSKN